jgi:hypothetical protein
MIRRILKNIPWVNNLLIYHDNRLGMAVHSLEYKRGKKGLRYEVEELDTVMLSVLEWLQESIRSQNGKGSSAYYSYRTGWKVSYPETTGYLITTLYDLYRNGYGEKLLDVALAQGEWLLDIQMENGGWQGLQVDAPPKATSFNTGMILDGMSVLATHTKENRYLVALDRAMSWLAENQDSDGCWSEGNFKGVAVTYNALISADMLKGNAHINNKDYASAAISQLEWVKKQINGNFIEKCDIRENLLDTPLMHYVGYTTEGMIRAGKLLDREDYIEAVLPVLDVLADIAIESGIVYGRYDRNWNPAVDWVCLTGAAQIAISLLLVEERNDKFREAATILNRYIASTVNTGSSELGIKGGVGGSYPIFGGYQAFQYVNWAGKYFIDACLLEQIGNPVK